MGNILSTSSSIKIIPWKDKVAMILVVKGLGAKIARICIRGIKDWHWRILMLKN